MPASTGVLFINKTAQSGVLSQSRGAEKALIYSHVQRSLTSTGPKKRQEGKVLYQLPDSWSEAPDEGGPVAGSNTEPRKSRSKPRKTKAKTVSKTQSQTEVAIDAMQALDLSSKPGQSQLMSLDRLSGGVSDPFDSLEEPICPYMTFLLSFFTSDVVPLMFPTKEMAATVRDYTIKNCIEDSLQRNSLLCTTSAALYANSGMAQHGVATMTFKGRALTNLRRRLRKPSGGSTNAFSSAYAVALLTYVECMLGNMEDLAAHVAGMRQLMIDCEPSACDDPPPILGTVFCCSYLGSAVLDDAPQVEPFGLGHSELSEAAEDALAEVLYGPFCMASTLFDRHDDFLGSALLDLALEQRTILHFRSIVYRGVYQPSWDDVQNIQARTVSVEYNLTALRADESLTPAQQALRLTLYIFPQPFMLVVKPNAAFCRAMTKRLRNWLEQSDIKMLWGGRCDLLFWILFMMSHISYGEEDWPWVWSHLSILISLLKLRSVQDMEELLHGFYYYPQFHRVTVERVWEEHARYVQF